MKLVRWKRFTWQLSKLPPLESKLPVHYQVRPATREEAKVVHKVVDTAYALESAWSDTMLASRQQLETQIAQVFERESVPALVMTHGQRIIAASVLSTEIEGETHLISGPCVLIEYCNRGIGTELLHASLMQLRAAGLETAWAIIKDNVPGAKFLYPKFGSVSEAVEHEPAPLVQ